MIWLVEVRFEGTGSWLPTVGAALSKSDGEKELAVWKQKLPNDEIRLKQYERKGSPL